MAASIFARIGTITGQSEDARHKNEIDVLSWSWGLSPSGTMAQGGGGGAGKASFQDLDFIHHVDMASPLLMEPCATGEHTRDATTTVRESGEGVQEDLVIKMTDVLVTSVSTGVRGEGGDALEAIALAFTKVDFKDKPQKQDGSLAAGIHFEYDPNSNTVG